MKSQDVLLSEIRKQLNEGVSIIDEVAQILNISYDASHRRVSNKSKFSIEETVELCNYFSISMDNLFFKKNKIVVEKTIEITSQKDMLDYFTKSAENIELLTKSKDTIMYYSAKDIPLFYFMEGSIMSKFKAYVWINLLSEATQKTNFEDFVINESFMDVMLKLKKAYEEVEIKEVWNDTTINSSLQQILYFYQAGLLNYNSANALLNELKNILEIIKQKCNTPNSKFSLYYNELILLNNNVLFETNRRLTLFVPYTLLGYFITKDKESCENVELFFKQQIKNSIPLNSTGIREQNQFFNKMNRKIDYFSSQIKSEMDNI